jgi:peroxiredoxin (alkyl hydroperoxide reductase subunit C)
VKGGAFMPEEFKPGCQRPSVKQPEPVSASEVNIKEVKKSMIKVGKPAPDFIAAAFHNGKFVNIGLSEYKGKWVLLCFYPGDFTFV